MKAFTAAFLLSALLVTLVSGAADLRKFWQPVFRGEDLAAGAAVPIRVMGEDFTLYRGQRGKPHIVGFQPAPVPGRTTATS